MSQKADNPVPCKGGRSTPKAAALLQSCAVLALLFEAGCAPDLGALPKPQEPADFQAAQSAPTADWPQSDWWKAYRDEQLDALVAEALKDSPDLEIAAARVRAAEAFGSITGADLWPTVVADGYVRETEPTQNQGFPQAFKSMMPRGWHHAASISASVQYEIDFFGKNRASFKAAMSDVSAAKAEQAAARLEISAAVVTTYAVLMQQFADRNTAADAVRIRSESATLVEQRWRSGLENEAAQSQAQAQLKAAMGGLKDADRQIALTRNQIAALLGKGPDRGLGVADAPTHTVKSAGLPANLTLDLIGRRPDVVATRHNVEAAASRIDVAEANFYPNVDLTGMFGLQGLDLKYLAQASSEVGAFGPAIHLPIFDYGRNTGIYRGARAEYDGAVALYNKTLTNALHEIADAYANRRALEGELADARGSLKDSENAYRVVQARYRSGLSRYLDVLTAENLLLQQRRAVADLESVAFTFDIALVHALGGGYVEESKN